MQIKSSNASTLVWAPIVFFAQLIWASSSSAQPTPNRPNLPTFTPASTGTTNIASAGPALAEATVVTIDPNQLVLNAIHQSVWGPALACKLYQRSQAFDQQVIVSGEYKSSGIGTGQFRYNARVSAGETTFDMVQVSDGRLMFTQIGLDEPPRRVNLDSVRQALGNAIHHASERPDVNFYLAVGGHPELLRSLYHRYFWYKAIARSINGVEVWQLEGRVRTDPPKFAGNTPFDICSMAKPQPGSSLPTEVRLTLGRSAAAAYFPYMVEYFQRIKNVDGRPDTTELRSVLEHLELTHSVTIVDKDFIYKVQDGVKSIEDETKDYLPNIPLADRAVKLGQ